MTAATGLAYCGNFGVPIWKLTRAPIAALGDDPLQPILHFWKRDRRTLFFSMRMNEVERGDLEAYDLKVYAEMKERNPVKAAQLTAVNHPRSRGTV